MDARPGDFDVAPYEDMSATMLSRQPASLPESLARFRDDVDWDPIFTHLESRMGSLRSWRYSWWAYWAVLAEFFIPRRYKWLVTANTMSRGRPINDAIIDSTGLFAVNVCASGLWSGLTSPSRPWFKLGPPIDSMKLDAAAIEWLEDTESKVYAVLGASNYYSTMAQAFQDVVVFGTAPVIMYEDAETIIRCYLPCAGEYYLASSGRMSVDTLYREFTMTVSAIVDMFRLKNCPQQVRKLWEQGGASLQNEFVVAHAIEPNFPLTGRGRNKGRDIRVVPERYAYREVYWLKGVKTDRPLSRKGFAGTKPFFAMRYSTVANDAYGRSPCMDALGDNRQVQVETRRKAEFIEKGVRPPMGADPALKNEPASIIPGQITYVHADTGKKGFWPLFEPDAQWLAGITQDIKGVNERIGRILFNDVFMAITQMQGVQPRNELELTKRDLERLQVLGPFIKLFEDEAGDPSIKRVIDILERRRVLKPRPPSLQGIPLKVSYISILSLAQRANEAVAMKDTFLTGGNLSAAAKAASLPDPLRIVNLDESYRRYAKINNYPMSCLFTDQEVAEQDAARNKANAESQILPTTMAGVQAARTLSETDISGGSALNALLTGQTAPQ